MLNFTFRRPKLKSITNRFNVLPKVSPPVEIPLRVVTVSAVSIVTVAELPDTLKNAFLVIEKADNVAADLSTVVNPAGYHGLFQRKFTSALTLGILPVFHS
jgi:hypothetical protein